MGAWGLGPAATGLIKARERHLEPGAMGCEVAGGERLAKRRAIDKEQEARQKGAAAQEKAAGAAIAQCSNMGGVARPVGQTSKNQAKAAGATAATAKSHPDAFTAAMAGFGNVVQQVLNKMN